MNMHSGHEVFTSALFDSIHQLAEKVATLDAASPFVKATAKAMNGGYRT